MKTYEEALNILRATLDLMRQWNEKKKDPYKSPVTVDLADFNADFYRRRFDIQADLISRIYGKSFIHVVRDAKRGNNGNG